MEPWHVSYRRLGMGLKRATIVAVVAILAACSSDGAVPTTEPIEAATTTSTSTTQLPRSTTTSSIRSTTTTVAVPLTLNDSGQDGFEDPLGTPERVCVDVDEIVATEEPEMVGPEDDQPVFATRSGEFVAGNFASVVGKWSEWPNGEVKLYWIPFDWQVAFTEPLEVTVEPLEGNGSAVIQTFDVRASNSGGMFWPSGTKFPAAGRYRLTAEAPGHWACFELTV